MKEERKIITSQAFLMPGLPPPKFSMKELIRIVAHYFKIRSHDITDQKRRFRKYVYPRQVAIYFSREFFPKVTLQKLGLTMGGLHHSSIIYANTHIEDMYSVNAVTRKQVDELRARIKEQKNKKVKGFS